MDFIKEKVLPIKELQCELTELVHKPTGARIVHLANNDDENVFCLSFRTTPDSSNGVPHILEHTVLCGSEKFPVKDPFFSMLRRSLNTFMNAFTGADFTCYPAASQVPKDFYNLLEVYLDAVFAPNLKELSFMQEGHHLDINKGKLEYKGIVFNEMKGAYSSPDSRLWNSIMASLYPDITYGHDSGGDPAVIPKLTYQQLLDFHHKFYHPGRCVFFFYGNIPLEQHLEFINDKILKKAKKAVPLPPIPKQKRFTKPIRVHTQYPVSPDDDINEKTWLGMGWLGCSILKQQEILGLLVLETVLMGTDAGLLKKPLLKSGLCKQASFHVDTDMSEIPLFLILKGCKPEDCSKLEKLILKTLREISENKIPKRLIDSAIHQLELSRKEITGDGFPYGLSLFMRAVLPAQHGGLLEDGLMIHSLFKELRKDCDLQKLIKKYFLNNKHRATIVMEPDPTLNAKEKENEEKALEKIRKKLSKEDIKAIKKQNKQLKKFQDEQEGVSLDVLPKVTLADVSVGARDLPLVRDKVGDTEIFYHESFTNDIVYIDISFDLPYLKQTELSAASFITNILPHMGCGGRDYAANLEYIQQYTGGVDALLSQNRNVKGKFKPSISLWGKALGSNVDKLAKILVDMTTSADFTDQSRIKELLLQHYIGLEQSLTSSAMQYASNLAASKTSQSAHVANYWFGLEYFWFVKSLLDTENDFSQLKEYILGNAKPQLIITCDHKNYVKLKKNNFYGLVDIPTQQKTAWRTNYKLKDIPSQGRIIPASVSFTCQLFDTMHYEDPDAPVLTVAAMLFRNKILHKRIREQGGAYGCGAVNNLMSGNFYLHTYRDPHIKKSLGAFSEAIQMAVNKDFTKVDLEEAKLGVIQKMDTPIAPGSCGSTAHAWVKAGLTLKRRQSYRDKILSTTPQDISKAVSKHLLKKESTIVTFAGKEILDSEKLDFDIYNI
jgi:presequence protease